MYIIDSKTAYIDIISTQTSYHVIALIDYALRIKVLQRQKEQTNKQTKHTHNKDITIIILIPSSVLTALCGIYCFKLNYYLMYTV